MEVSLPLLYSTVGCRLAARSQKQRVQKLFEIVQIFASSGASHQAFETQSSLGSPDEVQAKYDTKVEYIEDCFVHHIFV